MTPDELADRDDLAFASVLDGVPLQHGRTSQMIFPIDDLVDADLRRSARCCPAT